MIDKASIRKEALLRRDALDSGIKRAKDEKIRERLFSLPEFRASRIILLYASFRSEVDTFAVIRRSLGGKRIVLPKVNTGTGELTLYEIKDAAELAPGCFGVPEPAAAPEREMDVRDMDLVIVPGVAFDARCNRLGYGKGFYDKLLRSSRSPAIALSYEDQIVPSLPAESHDMRMDRIITEERIISCNG